MSIAIESRPETNLYRSVTSELMRLRRWPAVWIIGIVWMLLGLTFGYIFPYLTLKTGNDVGDMGEGSLAAVLPPGVPDVMVQGMPMFGAALALVLGAIVAGNGYGWGTWKTLYAHSRGRTTTTVGSLVATFVVITLIVVASVVVLGAAASTIALVEGESIEAPALGALAQAFGGAVLLMSMWALIGYALGTVVRGAALSVGLGLVWVLVVENLLRGVGALLDAVETVTEFMPGTAGGAFVGSIIDGDSEGTPGVLTTIDGTQAGLTVVAYLVAAVVVTLIVVRRRDVA